MNIVFLDVDGVLNSRDYTAYCSEKYGEHYGAWKIPFDPKCMENLKKIVEETKSKIVISSTWRKHEKNMEKLMGALKEYDLDEEVIGKTADLGTTRGQEIGEFLKALGGKHNFVILDDDNDMEEFMPHLVLTKFSTGLTEKEANEAIAMLMPSRDKKLDNFCR